MVTDWAPDHVKGTELPAATACVGMAVKVALCARTVATAEAKRKAVFAKCMLRL